MLARLSIRDIVLIERLDIEFSRGLAVLTGETGAGKSILLDAFALALGGRGDAGLVRHGAEQGQVIAVFQPHLYSRTRFFAAEFGAALGLADEQAGGAFNQSASAPRAGARPAGLRATPGSARPRH